MTLAQWRAVWVVVALLMATPAWAQDKLVLRDHDGVPVYRVPFYSSVPTRTVALSAHHDAVKRDKGWKVAYLDVGYVMSTPIFLEEIPASTTDVVGQKILAEIVYIVVSGEGVAVHRYPDGKEERSVLQKDDIFMVPYGHWIGFASAGNVPVRLMGWGVSLLPEMLDQSGTDLQFVDEMGLRPKEPWALSYVKYQNKYPAEAMGPVPIQAAKTSAQPSAVKKGHGFHVYQPGWAAPINMGTLETPPHHYPKRREEGWRDAHIELGGRAINNFIIQEEAPSFKEIGHKHAGDVMFYGLIGEGYIAFRPEMDSKEIRTMWGAGDFFVLPRVKGGVWHAHANRSATEKNRLIYTPPDVNANVLEDPYEGRMYRGYPDSEKEDDRDAVWDALRP